MQNHCYFFLHGIRWFVVGNIIGIHFYASAFVIKMVILIPSGFSASLRPNVFDEIELSITTGAIPCISNTVIWLQWVGRSSYSTWARADLHTSKPTVLVLDAGFIKFQKQRGGRAFSRRATGLRQYSFVTYAVTNSLAVTLLALLAVTTRTRLGYLPQEGATECVEKRRKQNIRGWYMNKIGLIFMQDPNEKRRLLYRRWNTVLCVPEWAMYPCAERQKHSMTA